MEYYGINCLTTSQAKKLGLESSEQKMDSKASYNIITNLVIGMIQKQGIIWRQSWSNNKQGQPNFPVNYATKISYSGLNCFLLSWQMKSKEHYCPYFMTSKEISEKGGNVKKGAIAYTACYCEKTSKSNTIKVYDLFNGIDIDGIKFDENWKGAKVSEKIQIDKCKRICSNMPNKPKIYYNDYRAYYTPDYDSVYIPDIEHSGSMQKYYSNLFHELVHSTAYSKRLNRQFPAGMGMGISMDDNQSVVEQLIAEVGASYLCGIANIEFVSLNNSVTRDKSYSYLQSWKKSVIRVLNYDNKVIFNVIVEAQRACDYILCRLDQTIYEKIKGKKTKQKVEKVVKKKALKARLTPAQARIKRISEVANEIQKSSGKTSKIVTISRYKVSRVEAVKRAAKQVN